MKTQSHWGIVLLAGGFAILAIGVAGATYVFENQGKENPAVVAVPTPSETAEASAPSRAPEDWMETLERFSSGSLSGLSPTDVLGLKLSEEYQTAFKEGEMSPEEQAEALSRLINENVPEFALEEEVTLSQLSLREEVVLDVYAQLALIILRESNKVREYELVSFSRAIRDKNYSGIPELKEAATKYKKIKDALVVMDVPPSVAREHLAVVNSVGSLANIVSLMSRWNGDPITGLSYLDTFLAEEQSLARNVDVLFTRLVKLS